jgi:hypothetical protein
MTSFSSPLMQIFMAIKKPYSRGPAYTGQGIRSQARPAAITPGANTFTLPCAGTIRIRFEGLPDAKSGSQSVTTDTPSIGHAYQRGEAKSNSVRLHSRRLIEL